MHRLRYKHNATATGMASVVLMLFMLCGCGQSDGPDPGGWKPGPESSVSFEAYINSTSGTRAATADLGQLKQTGFGVFASSTGDGDFNPDATSGSIPDFMYNQKVEWRPAASGAPGEGAWKYEPEKTWPGSKVSFFAYAPYTATFGETGITGITGPEKPGSPKLTFVSDSDTDRQIDLLYSDADRTTDMVAEGLVTFRFRHALSRIGFKCAATEILDGNTTVTIESVSLRTSDLGVSGNLNLRTGEWEDINKADKEYTLGKDDFKTGANVITREKGTAESILTADGKELMVIPSATAVPVTLTVRFTTKTADPGLAEGSISISNSVSSTFDHGFEAGKAYVFTLRIGMKTVEISTGITDWDDYETGWTPVEPQ